MSDSPRRAPRTAFVITAALALAAAIVLAFGGAFALRSGAPAPWLVGVAVILILTLTWLARQPRR